MICVHSFLFPFAKQLGLQSPVKPTVTQVGRIHQPDIFPGQILLTSPYLTHVLSYEMEHGLHRIKTPKNVVCVIIAEKLRNIVEGLLFAVRVYTCLYISKSFYKDNKQC